MSQDLLLVQYDDGGPSGLGGIFCLVRPLTWTDEEGGYAVGVAIALDPKELRGKRVWIRDWDGELWLLNEGVE